MFYLFVMALVSKKKKKKTKLINMVTFLLNIDENKRKYKRKLCKNWVTRCKQIFKC
jgi:hypothetical protein